MDRENVNPSTWGPPGWIFLDSIIQSYPYNPTLKDQIWMLDFMTSLGDALPCAACRASFKMFTQTNPVQIESQAKMKNWIEKYKQWSTHKK